MSPSLRPRSQWYRRVRGSPPCRTPWRTARTADFSWTRRSGWPRAPAAEHPSKGPPPAPLQRSRKADPTRPCSDSPQPGRTKSKSPTLVAPPRHLLPEVGVEASVPRRSTRSSARSISESVAVERPRFNSTSALPRAHPRRPAVDSTSPRLRRRDPRPPTKTMPDNPRRLL